MAESTPPTDAAPATREAVVDRYFLEHRAKLLDLAAFLDRCERAEGDDDFRVQAMREAVELLIDGQPNRTRRILEHLSDLSIELLDHAPGKGATGAPPPPQPDTP